jgi:DNA-binding transcriptional ArsR family regulator
MQDLLERLAEILSQQLVLYNKLLLNLSDQRCTLPTGNTEDIHEILMQQETLTLELKALEEARLTLMKKLSQHLQKPAEQLTLMKLANMVEEPFSSKYKKLSKQVKNITQQIDDRNQANKYLTDNSLDLINTSLRLFATCNPYGYNDQDLLHFKGKANKFQTTA